jgi:hypothetical protein
MFLVSPVTLISMYSWMISEWISRSNSVSLMCYDSKVVKEKLYSAVNLYSDDVSVDVLMIRKNSKF